MAAINGKFCDTTCSNMYDNNISRYHKTNSGRHDNNNNCS